MTPATVDDGLTASNRPWLALYSPGVPAAVEPAFRTMLSLFRAAVSRNPSGEALIYFDRRMSYADLDAASDALAVWLRDQGVARGDRVQVITQNIPAFPILCISAWKIGAVPVPGNPMYRATELARIFADSQPAAVLCQDTEAGEIKRALDAAGLEGVSLIVVSPQQEAATEASLFPTAAPAPPGARLSDIIDRHIGETPPAIELEPDDLGLILYTSGTTGIPKGAMLSHRNMTFNAETTRHWFALDERDRILAIAPFFHITGLICHVAVAFRAGCAMVMTYRFEPHTALAAIRREHPTFTVGAITAFNSLMSSTDATATDMASLTKVWSGGAPIPVTLRNAIQTRFGFVLNNAYGMTEVTSPVVMAPHDAAAPERDGLLPLGIPIPSTEIRVVDEKGRDLPSGEVGELLFRGPQVMAGYWRNPDDTATALASGWLHSGDVGYQDAAGWVYLVDRKKDCIIASGFKVWPREVEDVLYEHPAVREAAVIGVADPYRGETVKACVSLVAGAETTEQALADHCRTRLAAYKVPRLVAILPDLPKTITGKIQRAALRDAAIVR